MITPLRRCGRPPATRNLEALEVLTLPQVLTYARAAGRPMGRHRLMTAILTRQLPALQDLEHHDRYGNPLFMIRRADLDAWLASSLRPFLPGAMPGVLTNRKGPLPRAL